VKSLNVQTKQPTGEPTKDAAIKQVELAVTNKDPNEKPTEEVHCYAYSTAIPRVDVVE